MSTHAQGDLFTGRFIGRQKREPKAPVVLLPLVERIANEERALRSLTESRDASDAGRQRDAYARAVVNISVHLELLRAELAQEAA
jgi:hypothetical protein